ncbi:TPA: hypothetical protein NID03_003050 [Pseudomonas aeruginosa]|nr:hypothetical protein [Pseudomonas aeruginosa]
MKHLDMVKAQLYEEMSKSPSFGAYSHELHMANSFLMGIKSEIESCTPMIHDPRLESTKIELMGFNVVIDDSLKEFEFRLRLKR